MIEINNVQIDERAVLSVRPIMGGRGVQVRWIENDKSVKRTIEGVTVSEVMNQVRQAKLRSR